MTSLQERLFAIQDKQYAAFQAKLTPGVPMESFIGIRVPVLRKFAKEFTKEAECEEFLHQLPHKYYDENMLHGLLISEVKDYEKIKTWSKSSHVYKTALLPGRTTRPSRRPSRATESRPSRRNICGH